ncbi:MAG: FHA domain-containing protein [Planctomycetales bacterium]|nr:FHA domain-containing protein [Planctomycetales bacterium]
MAEKFEPADAFWKAHQHLNKASFVRAYPHPFLAESEGPPQAAVEDRDFQTVTSGSAEDRARFRRTLQITLKSRIIPLVKDRTQAFHDKITVGRTPNNDIVVKHGSVSKFHAYFLVDPRTFNHTLVDAGSTNGTFVNDVRLTALSRRELKNGDAISFGGDLDYLFLYSSDLFSRLQILMKFAK